ncbi:glutathione peroxidase, house-cleaning role in reducing lipid peroxides [Flexilinea flocculi]|jgi:glutathione peroxidase|uniref:Glutathione peroxidase n=2 Tax=Flexilinea flocculi TaxID=1678840 RepID=A0A0S7BRQ1_9CHLR|nr:glutathione peroxidase, house-cleaning role in reducing lipid peroxides [Flexilinea flocculi]
MKMGIYDFSVLDVQKNKISLSEYAGKVLLIVNTATGCGYTPQYEALESLYKKYKDQGFEILDFPCNQFLHQAPGSDEEIQSFCQMKYGTTFKTFSKIEVNGEKEHPLYTWLKENSPDETENEEAAGFKKVLMDLAQSFTGNGIKWNFTKFLIGRNGNIIARFSPAYKPEDIDSYVEAALKA